MSVTDAPQDIPLAPEAEPITYATRTRADVDPDVEFAGPIAVKPERLTSLDVFRGITIASMLLVNNPGGKAYGPLEHADWHGWTPTDLIFPFFLFIVGVAIPFSLGKRSATETRGEMFLHVWSRALSLVLLGLLLQAIPWINVTLVVPGYKLLTALHFLAYGVLALGLVALLVPWRSRRVALLVPPIVAVVLLALGWSIYLANSSAYGAGLSIPKLGNGIFTPSQMRFPGVLQRIGICYGVAATIALVAGWRTILLSLVVFFAAFSWLMLNPPDGKTVSLSKEDNFARRVDERVFDRYTTTADGKRQVVARHTYAEYPDPEGLVSTLPAIGSALLGILAGYALRRTDRTNAEKCARLLAHGVLVSIAGVLLSWWLMPINKKIWTPSFTVFTAGMGMLTLGAVFYLMDIKGRRAWAWPFKVYGLNAIAAYVFAGIVVRVMSVIKVGDVSAWRFCQMQVRAGVAQAGEWWLNTMPKGFPPLNTPENGSLAFALAFVVAMLLVMSVMYAFRIFLKV